tara:strand:- start:5843 stop:6304 length:462 start_codon:yes stop_codon:yes gene_type:complete
MNCLKEICENYNNALNDIFGNNRITFDVCHDNRDFVIRGWEREILKAIIKFHKEKYNVYWSFRETMFGKYIISDVNQIINHCKIPCFNDFEKYYKFEYLHRMNTILDGIVDSSKKIKILEIKDNKYPDIIKDNKVDFDRYKELRNEIDKIIYI